MVVSLLPNGKQTFVDGDGNPLAAGKVYFYIPDTSPPEFKDTWSDIDQTSANSNPVILDSAGRAVIWGSGIYRQVVYDLNDVLIWDELTSSGPDANIDTFYDFAVFMEGVPLTAEEYPILAIVRNLSLPAGLTNSQFKIKSTSLPTAPIIVSLYQNSTLIGTITFDTAGIPTVSFLVAVFFVPGDTFSVIWPDPQDATAGNISLTFVFTVG